MLVLDGAPVEVAVTQEGGAEAPALRLGLTGARRPQRARSEARAPLERMLALELDIDPFYALAAGDPALAPLVGRSCGLRPPRFATVFECLVHAIALQQLSFAAGLALVNRLSRAYGAPSSPAGGARPRFRSRRSWRWPDRAPFARSASA